MSDTFFKVRSKGYDKEIIPIWAPFDMQVLYGRVIPFGVCHSGDRVSFVLDGKNILNPVNLYNHLYNLSNIFIYREKDYLIKKGDCIHINIFPGPGKIPQLDIGLSCLRIG